ncbi:winged helix-turn-helix domain-containing protein [Ideonella azotifigens]|uniref:Winged helix-turn-helix domain-containing protein n=2 Tax=Ideonella azotifigens TaxID=513160 RepID=A0ABP3UZ96_9BURK|nr:winged helix-turn-helix domain-containing protein [Ideonella azotifigens]MCD2339986.1 winged helix-turn-helix domain-containing protein [Ideonella azotifigens]
MADGPPIARVAALIGDPTRAEMLATLMAGQALTATELAQRAGVGKATASTHLARLVEAQLLVVSAQGRHRYFRLADPDVAQLLESLMGVAARSGARRLRPGPKEPALREARVCYDHLAGERGVQLMLGLRQRGLLPEGDGVLPLAPGATALFGRLGLVLSALQAQRRPLCRSCMDWSERRHHLGGALGAAVLDRVLSLGWARREANSRVLKFTGAGEANWTAWIHSEG